MTEVAGTNKAGISDGISVELNGEVVGVAGPDPEVWHEDGGLNASNRDVEAAYKAYMKAEAAIAASGEDEPVKGPGPDWA